MHLKQGIKSLFGLTKPLALALAYGAWILLLRLLFLSFLVYFLTRQGQHASFEEINEAFAANELPFMGMASGLFAVLLYGFSPLIDRAGHFKITRKQLRTSYLPGFARGFVLAASIVAGFLIIGNFHYVGFFVQIEDVSLASAGILLRVGALLALAFCDELVFRSGKDWTSQSILKIAVIALAYCVVKMAQFELSWMHFATLFLLSATLSQRRSSQESFLSSAAFVGALLIVFHPLCSLPIFGSDFSGIFLLKYQPIFMLPPWISGGIGGPLSSVGLQAVLLIELVRGYFAQRSAQNGQKKTQKKPLFKLSTSQ